MGIRTVVSASGKVLIAGGYLILDPKYSGIVIATSSRFYTVIEDRPREPPNRIRVRSPQFLNANWEYSVHITGTSVTVEDITASGSKNKFIHLAIQNAIALILEIKGIDSVNETLSIGLEIIILGDNDFYSQREKLASLQLPRTLDSLNKIPPFAPTGVPLSDVHKTGLGSSAALTTSLVTALLMHFQTIPIFSLTKHFSDGQLLASNLAQYVHCLAQGKVGSGFDVAAATFGSHLYKRFNPSVLHNLMNDNTSQPLSPVLIPANKAWDYDVKQFKLPPLTRIMLADINAGSDTPSLVGQVLKWRAENPEQALNLWTELDKLNTNLAQALTDLTALYDKDPASYITAVKYIGSLQPIQWGVPNFLQTMEQPIISKFYETHQISQAIRVKMREMGHLSGVSIEPSEQTQLLDVCVSLAGVVGGGVPGAGGYDAIWLLVCEPVDASPDIRPLERVERVWSEYTALDVSPLSVMESLVDGMRVEDFDVIRGLKNAVASK